MHKQNPADVLERLRSTFAKAKKSKHFIWQLPLSIVFLCFGLLLMAQYQTHLVESGALANESASDLAQIMKSVNDANEQLNNELDQLNSQLAELQAAAANGESLNSSLRASIEMMQTVIGYSEISGSGVSLTVTDAENLIYQDIIDIVNELFNSGAEAVAINNIRFTSRTLISEVSRSRDANPSINEDGQAPNQQKQNYYVITVNGQELLPPLVIKAIGDPATLEAALTYPGGIISSLTTLYGMSATIRQAANLVVPAAKIQEFQYASPIVEE